MSTFIALISTTGFVRLWFVTVNRELSQARQSVVNAAEEVRMHMDIYSQVQDGEDEQTAKDSLDICRRIYDEMVKYYHTLRYKPINRIPAFILRYRPIK